MFDRILTDSASKALAKALEGTSKRQEALAANVANAETPGYVREDVEFRGALAAAVESAEATQAGAIDEVEPYRIVDPSGEASPDGNNVNLEHEMAELARNGLEFEASARMLSLKIRILRAAISEGRK